MSQKLEHIDIIEKLSQPFNNVLIDIVRDSGDDTQYMTDCIPLSNKLSEFPYGGCRFSSIVFGLLLRKRKIVTTLVEGWQCTKCDDCKTEDCEKRREHVWLEYNGWIIDLTVCQFPGFPAKPMIDNGSDWHATSWRILHRKNLEVFEVGDRRQLIDELEL